MIGRTISHYEIVERIGAGGMGEVYKARDTLLGRFVAVKVLPAALSEHPDRRRRFLREARTASGLNHRSIITIHDVVSSEGADHIIMELVDGEPLDRVVPEGGLQQAQALDYAIQIADALVVAHRAGVIHRDLKPSNVMVTGEGEVKVLDFGLAKFEEAPLDSRAPTELAAAPLTRAGMLLGTLDFMSPEQAMGEPVDARSDIFSFGILLYVLLTGQRPFRGKNAASLVHAVAYDEPPNLGELRAGLPPLLLAVVQRALRKKREDRFQTMEEVARSLRELTAAADGSDQPTLLAPRAWLRTSRPISYLRRLFPSRNRRLALVSSLLLLLVLTTALVAPLRQGVAALLRSAIGQSGEVLTTHGLLERGLSYLARADHKGNIERAIADFQRILSDDENHAAALAGLARAYWRDATIGSQDKSRMDQALAVAESAVAADELLVMARASRGLVYQELGRLDEAQADFERALALEPLDAASLDGMGRLQEARGELEESERYYRRAIEAQPDGWSFYARLGTLLHRQGRYPEAEEVLLRGLEVVPDSATNHRNLGVVYYMQGKLAEAASAFQRSLQIQPEPWLYSNLGTIQFAQGLYPQAVAAFEKAIETGGANSYPVWANLADSYRWTPDSEAKARDAYLRALQLLEEKLAAAPDDPTLGSRKALYLAKRGERDAALSEIARLEALESLDSGAWYRLAVANEVVGQREEALAALGSALEAGYSPSDVESDPELLELRRDPGYHRRMARMTAAADS